MRQLRRWNSTGLLVPEVQTKPRLLYSFRDVVALRTIVHFRSEVDSGNIDDLVRSPGQHHGHSLAEIFAPFKTHRGHAVVDFLHPRKHLEIRAGRMGGWPTIADTRIPYDTIANLLVGGEVAPEEVSYYYPEVAADAARDALDFHAAVRSRAA